MGNRDRLITTAIIWIGVIIFLSNVLTSATSVVAGDSAAAFGITLVVSIAAAFSTLAIWVFGSHSGDNRSEEARAGKSKRHDPNRVRRLMEDLNDDEIYELESMLLGQQQQQNDPRRRGQ